MFFADVVQSVGRTPLVALGRLVADLVGERYATSAVFNEITRRLGLSIG